MLEEGVHCPWCGRKKPRGMRQLTPEAVWKVTTEGDVEGRTLRTVGFFSGRLPDVVAACADRASWTLWLRKATPEDAEGADVVPIPEDEPAAARSVDINTVGWSDVHDLKSLLRSRDGVSIKNRRRNFTVTFRN